MMKQRKSREEGHRRKFLVVIDDTPECHRALIYAARRAEHTGGGLVLLYVISTGEFQHWIGVEDIMRAEAREEAEAVLARYENEVNSVSTIRPELVILEGQRAPQIMELIEEDEDIAILVLAAAAAGSEGPGPLIASLANKSDAFPIPVTIVPGDLTDEDMDAIV
uniref:universal stress protein n=1 Tax=Pararhizobium sp. IMCC3301 TaxID=3067904 RepID=UPI00274200F2|nr:universal stress protein [Pararhizobium sp. IMCC3301]